jgi:MFS family permease
MKRVRESRLAGLLNQLFGPGKTGVFLTVSLGVMLSLGVRLIIPALIPQLKISFGFGNALAGMLISLQWATFASMQLFGGMLGDFIGERNTLLVGFAVATVSFLLMVGADALLLFLLGIAGFSFGTGIFGTTRFTILARTYDADITDTAVGITTAAGNLARAVFPLLAGVLTATYGWRYGLGYTLPLFFLVLTGIWVSVPVVRSETNERLFRSTLVRGLTAADSRRLVWIGVAMIAMAFCFQGVTGFYVTYLVSVHELSQEMATTLFSVYFIIGTVVQTASGELTRRYNAIRALVAISTLTAGAILLLVAVSGLLGLTIVTLLLGVQLGFWPISQAHVLRTVPEEFSGSLLGLIRMFFLGLGAAGPVTVGLFADRKLFSEAFVLLAVSALLSALLFYIRDY